MRKEPAFGVVDARPRSRRRRFRVPRTRMATIVLGLDRRARRCYSYGPHKFRKLSNCGYRMTSVRVRENEPFEAALRRFKRTIEKDRPPDRAPRPRVLRKADRPSASARRPPRSSATTSASAASSCRPSSTDRRRHRKIIVKGRSDSPLLVWDAPRTTTLKARITEDMKTAMRAQGHGALVGDPAAAGRDQAARGRRANRA